MKKKKKKKKDLCLYLLNEVKARCPGHVVHVVMCARANTRIGGPIF